MEVGGRPPVALTEGQGSGRLISAVVDGYKFRFAPANSVMDVEVDGTLVASEEGRCVTLGGPVNDSPLKIGKDESLGLVPEPDASTNDSASSADKTAAEGDSVAAGKQWTVTEDSSAFDDSRTVVLSAESNEFVRGQFGPAGPAVMHLRCMENTTAFYLWLNDLFLSDIQGFGVIDYRIDDRKASTLRGQTSTDNKAIGLWSGRQAIPFIKEMLGAEQVVFRVTPFNESPVEFTVDISGLEAVITPLREACAW